MINYIVVLSSLILDSTCFAFCLKFIITREWYYWIAPLLLSLSMAVASIMCLMSITLENNQPQIVSFAFALSAVLAVISFLWLISLLLFNYRIKNGDK